MINRPLFPPFSFALVFVVHASSCCAIPPGLQFFAMGWLQFFLRNGLVLRPDFWSGITYHPSWALRAELESESTWQSHTTSRVFEDPEHRVRLGLCPHQPYQTWPAKYLAEDSNAQGLPKIWLQSVKGTATNPLAAKKLITNQTYVKIFSMNNLLVRSAGAINQTDP